MFGIKLSGSASKSKTNSTASSTTTPIVPEWASSLTQNVASRVGGLTSLDPGSLVAPVHGLQTQAAGSVAGLSSDRSWLSPYMNGDTPFASGGKAYDFVDRYMNPYLKDVVDSSAADFDAHAGQVRAQQALDLAGAGAFGGSGAALAQSMTEGELARARATSLSGLRSHAYDTALGSAAGDADRATQARIANAQMALQDRAQKVGWGFQADANQRANVEAQSQLGESLRGIDQQQRQAPVASAQQVVAMLSGLPMSLFTGEQKNQQEHSVTKNKSISAEGSISG